MNDAILQQHINRILENVATLMKLVERMSYDTFRKEEQVKETAYSLLQEMGQAAHEINTHNDVRLDIDFDMAVLANFRQARYNQEAEISHQNAWTVITQDLPELAEQLEQAKEYNEVTS